MKKILLICFTAITILGCGVNKQAQQIKALEKCKYKVVSATNISVAGTDVKKIMNNQSFNIGSLPALAFGLLRRDVPLHATLNMEVTNPSNNVAAVNQFEYQVLINGQEIANGLLNQEVSIAPGQVVVVPLEVNTNVYQFINNAKVMGEIAEFLRAGKGNGPERTGLITLKIRPSFMLAGALIKYPGFITINKEISSKVLL